MVDTFLDKVYQIGGKKTYPNIIKDIKAKGFNCLINDARKKISFEDRIFFNNGMTVPTKIIEKQNENNNAFGFGGFGGGMDYDAEYVIYDSKLVNIKYIIEVEN